MNARSGRCRQVAHLHGGAAEDSRHGRLIADWSRQGHTRKDTTACQSIACRHVDIDGEFVLQVLLDADEVERIEPAVAIVVDEEIGIACWLCLIAHEGAEQVKRSCPQRLEGLSREIFAILAAT
jgi:hypothetical protein